MTRTTLTSLLAGTCLCTLAVVTLAEAATVTLETEDGSVRINGELLNFDGTSYEVETAIGTVSVMKDMVSCVGEACPSLAPEQSEFAIAGSKALAANLIPELVKGYGGAQQGKILRTSAVGRNAETLNVLDSKVGRADVTLTSTNSRDGIGALLNGNADLALATRPARSRELRDFQAKNLGDLRSPEQEHIVAIDALLLVTHPQNPVRAVTEAGAALAFSGGIENWAQLGGADAPINLYVRDADSGTREVFDNLLMRPNAASVATNVTVLGSDAEVAAAVLRDPNGLGFTSYAQAGDARALDIEGVCGLRTPANALTIKTEEYPLTRLLYMYQTNGELPWHAQDFLTFVNSPAGQTVVAKAGFVDQSITSETINSQGIRVASAVVNNSSPSDYRQMQEMFSLLLSADRLSTTFRFETGSARLDARAQADIGRLATLLQTEQFANKEVIFVGFTDSVGKNDLNRILSEQRAELVRRSVLGANPELRDQLKTRAVGFGEISPLGCNETGQGRRINRRVEVWVQDIVADNRLAATN
ncbi:MAG: phosphate ABC transporter substrate-binding/OmpA family protein [Pseudomonadota bacterium]